MITIGSVGKSAHRHFYVRSASSYHTRLDTKGNRSETCVNSAVVNFINLDQTFALLDNPRRFCNLETIGISSNHDRSVSAKDSKLLGQFRACFRVEDQSLVLSLPKDTALSSNRVNAEKT